MKNEGLNNAIARVTEEQARDWYQQNHLTTTGYLLLINTILERKGLPFPSDDFNSFCKEWGIKNRSFHRAISMLRKKGIHLYQKKVFTDSPEAKIQTHLHSELGGQREVKTESGFIDLLTETEIIEVKEVSRWKEALGQVMSYGIEYPNHEKRIHLFGESDRNLDHISDVCSQYGIVVTFEQVNP